MSDLQSLRDRHIGEECWIVGLGPSIQHLSADHFGSGPIITINEAILKVEALALTNETYSMQKDGWPNFMVRPADHVTLLLQTGLSDQFFPDHPKRIFFNPMSDWKFKFTEMSIRMCIALAKTMGCTAISFVCCDSLTTNEFRRYSPKDNSMLDGQAGYYSYVKPLVLEDVRNIDHRFILPKGIA